MMVERLKHVGTSHSSSDRLKICVKMGASWSAQVFRQAADTVWAWCIPSHVIWALLSSGDMRSIYQPSVSHSLTLYLLWQSPAPYIYIYIYIYSGAKKVFSQPPTVQVLPLKKMREACNFHHRYTSTMRDKIRRKKSRKSHCRIFKEFICKLWWNISTWSITKFHLNTLLYILCWQWQRSNVFCKSSQGEDLPTTIPRSKSLKTPFFPILMLGLNFSKSVRHK